MNVASLELSKELYELSGWVSHDYCYYDKDSIKHAEECSGETDPYKSGTYYAPAYDLGFLLRKLPPTIQDRGDKHFLCITCSDELIFGAFYCDFQDHYHQSYAEYADTPEDCAAKLAIELFQQGVLKRKGDE